MKSIQGDNPKIDFNVRPKILLFNHKTLDFNLL